MKNTRGRPTYALKWGMNLPPTFAIDLMGNLLVCSESVWHHQMMMGGHYCGGFWYVYQCVSVKLVIGLEVQALLGQSWRGNQVDKSVEFYDNGLKSVIVCISQRESGTSSIKLPSYKYCTKNTHSSDHPSSSNDATNRLPIKSIAKVGGTFTPHFNAQVGRPLVFFILQYYYMSKLPTILTTHQLLFILHRL